MSARVVTTTGPYRPTAEVAVERIRDGAYLEASVLDPSLRGLLLPIRGWSR